MQHLIKDDFLCVDIDDDAASNFYRQIDFVKGLNRVYASADEWADAVPDLHAKFTSLDVMRLVSSEFSEYDTYDYTLVNDTPPDELGFMVKTFVGALLRRAPLDRPALECATLARATVLAGTRSSKEVRDNPASELRRVAEELRALVLRHKHMEECSDEGIATTYVQLLANLHLPACFARLHLDPMDALEELKAAFAFAHGSEADIYAVEKDRIKLADRVYVNLQPVLSTYTSSPSAMVGIETLCVQMLDAATSGASTLVKLGELDSFLNTDAWRAFFTHAGASSPPLEGAALVQAMVRSHRDTRARAQPAHGHA